MPLVIVIAAFVAGFYAVLRISNWVTTRAKRLLRRSARRRSRTSYWMGAPQPTSKLVERRSQPMSSGVWKTWSGWWMRYASWGHATGSISSSPNPPPVWSYTTSCWRRSLAAKIRQLPAYSPPKGLWSCGRDWSAWLHFGCRICGCHRLPRLPLFWPGFSRFVRT